MSSVHRACLVALALGLLALPICKASLPNEAIDSEEFAAMVEAIATEEGAQPFLATALMEGGKQVPLALNTSTTAVFTVAIGLNQSAWAVEVVGVDKMTMAHIHWGNASSNGLPIVLLGPSGTAADLASLDLPMYSPPLSGTISMASTFTASDIVVPGTELSLEGLQEAILAGTVYVNVHTVAAPAGLVRGQLEPVEA